jgi:FkbM family methyltransferase
MVVDKKLGRLAFPKNDNVMAPTIDSQGCWEPNEITWLEENLTEGNRCLNIGANVGYFTILMAQLVGQTGFVYSVEPNDDLIPFFNFNIKSRDLKNVELFPFAVGEFEVKSFLYKNKNNYGDARMFDPRLTSGGGDWQSMGFEFDPPKSETRIMRIADLGLGKLDVVLVDAQGFDHFALRGMELSKMSYLPKILTEFVPEWIGDLGDDPAEILKEYKAWGYKVQSIDFPELNSLSEKEFVNGIESHNAYFTNLALIPNN